MAAPGAPAAGLNAAPEPPGGTVLVLGAGGARGPAHAGVIDRLVARGVRFDAILGCSIGAVVGALYAALGVEPAEMIRQAGRLTRSSLLTLALRGWGLGGRGAAAKGAAAPILETYRLLAGASFERLRPGIRGFGALALSLPDGRVRAFYGGPGRPVAIGLQQAVRASTAIPALFPPVLARLPEGRRLLCDPGWFTAVPVEAAFAAPVHAARVIAVDLALRVCPRQARAAYWEGQRRRWGGRLVVLRPAVRDEGTILPRAGAAERLAAAGAAAVEAPEVQAALGAWGALPAPRPLC